MTVMHQATFFLFSFFFAYINLWHTESMNTFLIILFTELKKLPFFIIYMYINMHCQGVYEEF